MSSAINAKRQQLRKDIIKKQKQELFMQIRKEMIRHMQYPQGISNPVKDLKQRNKIKDAFEYIKLKITESDFFQDLMKFMDEGLINVLIGYLYQRIQVQSVLQIISLILDKNNINFDKAFYHYGLIQYVFQYLHQSYSISSSCMRILNVYTQKSVDYCQLLLQNSKHQVLIQYFMKRANYSRNPQDQNDNQGEKIYAITLLVLQNLITAQYESQTYTQHKLQIFQFVLVLVQKRLFLKQTLGMLYQCVEHILNLKQYFNLILNYINVLLTQVSSQDKYVYNLFALIFKMLSCAPIQLTNFNAFIKIGLMCTRVNRPFIRILQLFVSYNSQCLSIFPKDEQAWQKLFLATQDPKTEKILLNLIQYLQIRSRWIWKYYSAALTSSNQELQIASIDTMTRILKKIGYQEIILNYLHLHRIPNLLQKIVSVKIQNKLSLVEKATNLLEYILGPLTEESGNQSNSI